MVMKYEWQKLFIKQKGIVIIVVFLLVECILFAFTTKNQQFVSPADEIAYNEYMQIVSGKLTDEKADFILKEQELLNSAKQKKLVATDSLVLGNSTSEEYIKAINEIEEILRREPATKKLVSAYNYVKEAPKSRYFVNDNFTYLSGELIDWVLVLTILLLSTACFLQEQQSGMILFIKTTHRGRHHVALCKLTMILTVSVVLSLAVTFLRLAFYGEFINAGLLAAPLQSIAFFTGSTSQLTVLQAIIVIALIKCVGYISFAGLCILIGEAFHSISLSVFAPILAILLPEALFASKSTVYRLPLPIGLMKGTGYFKGEEYTVQNKGLLTQTSVKTFDDIPIEMLFIVIAAALILILAAGVICIKNYKNGLRKKKLMISVFMALPLLLFAGCSSQPLPCTVNLNDTFKLAQNENYIVTTQGSMAYFQRVGSAQKQELIRSPFIQAEDRGNIISGCIYGENYYYMTTDFLINCISLIDFSEKIIYVQTKTDEDNAIHSFFANNKNLFLISHNGRVTKVNQTNGMMEVILDEGIFNNNISFDGNTIFFINDKMELKKYDTQTKKLSKLSEKMCREMYLTEEFLLYSCEDGAYKLSSQGSEKIEMEQTDDFNMLIKSLSA